MLAALSHADAITWVSIILKALTYAATLLATGSVLVLLTLREMSKSGRGALRRTAVLMALAAALCSALRLPIRASFLMGGTWEGAFDPMILGLVAESPLGISVAVRLAGLALVLCVLWRTRLGQALGVVGAVIVAMSFALRGHALSEPQMILGALLTVHILCLAFWVGAFAPLARAARTEPPERAGALAQAFGRQALWAVSLLVLAGGVTLAMFGAATPSALLSPYGQMVAVKLLLFAGVLTLAAVNKLALTPALLASKPGAGVRLRRAIRIEAGLIAGILGVTATFTTLSSPPDRAESELASGEALPYLQAHQMFGDAS